MRTENQIRASYNEACNAANELEDVANSLNRLAQNDFGGVLNMLRGAWSGENADRFMGKGEKVKNEIMSTAKTLRNHASDLRQSAKNTYQREMTELANERARLKAIADKAAESAKNLATAVTAPDTNTCPVTKPNSSNPGGGTGAFGGGGAAREAEAALEIFSQKQENKANAL